MATRGKGLLWGEAWEGRKGRSSPAILQLGGGIRFFKAHRSVTFKVFFFKRLQTAGPGPGRGPARRPLLRRQGEWAPGPSGSRKNRPIPPLGPEGEL